MAENIEQFAEAMFALYDKKVVAKVKNSTSTSRSFDLSPLPLTVVMNFPSASFSNVSKPGLLFLPGSVI